MKRIVMTSNDIPISYAVHPTTQPSDRYPFKEGRVFGVLQYGEILWFGRFNESL